MNGGTAASRGRDVLGALLAGAIVVAVCLALLWQKPAFFWNDDYQVSILPAFADVARSWSEGELPLLSPYSWVCGNLAGEFQYGTFSVFVNAAVVAIWSFSLGFAQQAAALSIAHLFLLAAGGYVLARGRDLPASVATLVGVVAALNGWIMCWGASDWFGALAAFTWLPWSWWALEFAARQEGPRWRALLPAPFIYLLIAGGFPYTVLMLIGVTGWLALRALVEHRDWRAIVRMSVGWIFGVAISAPAWLALLDLSRGSRRAAEVFPPRQWVVPFDSLPGLIVPSWTVEWVQFEGWTGRHEAIELACGMAPAVLLIGAAFVLRRRFFSALRWELLLLVAVWVLGMLPGAGLFRFSFRWLPLFHVVLALTAAEAWRLWNAKTPNESSRFGLRNAGTWAVLLTGAVVLAGPKTTFALLVLGVAVAWWLLAAFRRSGWTPVAVAAVAFYLSFTWVETHGSVAKYNLREELRDPQPLATNRLYLSIYRGPHEFYRSDQTGWSFGEAVRPGSTSMFAAVQLVNGYSPVSPAGIARLLDVGTHGHLHPGRVEDIVIPESGSGGLLEQLGIDGIVVAWDYEPRPEFPADEWQLAREWNDGYVLHRREKLPHVRELTGAADIQLVENSRHRVVAEISPHNPATPVRLLFSRPFFRGYVATFNGEPVEVGSWRGLIPTVELPAGAAGRLQLHYRPQWLLLGGTISIVALLTWAAGVALLRTRGKT